MRTASSAASINSRASWVRACTRSSGEASACAKWSSRSAGLYGAAFPSSARLSSFSSSVASTSMHTRVSVARRCRRSGRRVRRAAGSRPGCRLRAGRGRRDGGPHEEGFRGKGQPVGHPAAARRPPQVVLHAVGAAERRSTPAAVPVPAALHDGGSPVRRQVLEHDSQPPVEVRPHAQVIRYLRMQPDAVAQAAELRVVRLRQAIGPERREGSGRTSPASVTALHAVMLARP